MRMSRVAIAGLVCLLLPVCFILVAYTIYKISDLSTIYATPDKESAFIQSYSPQATLKAGVAEYQGAGGAGSSASAGDRLHQYVTNTRDFQPCLTIEEKKRDALTVALSDDMVEQLKRSGAEVVGRTGDSFSGFHITYRAGKNAGTATISPLAASDCGGYFTATGWPVSRTRPPGIQDVAGNISIKEKWFPTEQAALTEAGVESSATIAHAPSR